MTYFSTLEVICFCCKTEIKIRPKFIYNNIDTNFCTNFSFIKSLYTIILNKNFEEKKDYSCKIYCPKCDSLLELNSILIEFINFNNAVETIIINKIKSMFFKFFILLTIPIFFSFHFPELYKKSPNIIEAIMKIYSKV